MNYVKRGVEVLDRDHDTAVVYGNAEYFGEKQGIWKPGPFNLQKLMVSNSFDACAVIRKSVFEKVGLYDESMKLGWEDWDMWLRIAFANYKFNYVDEVLFDYRVTSTSMSKTLYSNYEKPNSIENYVHQKYPEKMGHHLIVDHYTTRFRKNPFLFVTKLFLRGYFRKYYDRLLKKE